MIACEHCYLCHNLRNSCYKVWKFNSDTTERPDFPMVNFVKFTLLARFSLRSVPFSLGSQNNVECESVGFEFLTLVNLKVVVLWGITV
jgi:hypothetical protein